jgi:predicted GNAT family acetyltransferase
MSELPPDVTAADRPDLGRYELRRGDDLLAFADYTVHQDTAEGDVLELPHTVTVPAHRGNGHAGQLIAFALADIQRSGRRVLPTCWFVAQFIDDHPEYADLVAGRPGS